MRLFRILLAIAVTGLLTYLSPFQRPHGISELREGSVAPERINAPFLFLVRKSTEELEIERNSAEKTVPTVLQLHDEVKELQLSRFDSVLAVLVPNSRMQMPDSLKYRRLQRELPGVVPLLSETSLKQLISLFYSTAADSLDLLQHSWVQLLTDLYSTGVISGKQGDILAVTDQVRVGETPFSIELLHSESDLKRGELMSLIESYQPIEERGVAEAVHELLALFVYPNLSVDESETNRLRAEARRQCGQYHAPLSPRRNDHRQESEGGCDPRRSVGSACPAVCQRGVEASDNPLFADTLRCRCCRIPAFDFRQLPGDPGAADIRKCRKADPVGPDLNGDCRYRRLHPCQRNPDLFCANSLAAMLMTILLSPQIGLVVSFLLALFIGSLFGDFYVTLVLSLTSAVSVHAVRHVRHRNQFYRAMILLPASYCLLIAGSDLLRFIPNEEIYGHVLPGVFTGLAAPIVIQGLLPIFESLFHITTDITLLELSDLNRPLLRELAIRAPGTYTHSLIMANLSEAAGQAIGANPLLARVGCYYHDIGKMLKPEYFTENQSLQGGRNPHDQLTPSMSMLIIDSHVKDGIELAEEHGLPKALIDLIPQHHGTTVHEFFYTRAVELGVGNVRRDDFRYDGPKPQTREAGILMLADSVESAARTLSERTPDRVRQLVRQIVQQKFTSGELDECPLTLRDLHRIEESFIPVLMGTLHGRLEYPWQKKGDRKEAKNAESPVPIRRT